MPSGLSGDVGGEGRRCRPRRLQIDCGDSGHVILVFFRRTSKASSSAGGRSNFVQPLKRRQQRQRGRQRRRRRRRRRRRVIRERGKRFECRETKLCRKCTLASIRRRTHVKETSRSFEGKQWPACMTCASVRVMGLSPECTENSDATQFIFWLSCRSGKYI